MINLSHVRNLFLVGIFLIFPTLGISTPFPNDEATYAKSLSLEHCVEVALQNNHRRPASRYAVAMAEAQHRQALAGYWPQIGAKGGFQRMDESTNFLFPAKSFSVPAGTAIITMPNPAAPPQPSICQ